MEKKKFVKEIRTGAKQLEEGCCSGSDACSRDCNPKSKSDCGCGDGCCLKGDSMKRILFVCTENSARSQMAEALFNVHNKNPQYEAISAGINPAKAINQDAVQAMKEKGIDISRKLPKTLTLDMARTAYRIYTMGCSEGCPVTPPEKTEDWTLENPNGKPIGKFREVRDEIERRVKKVVLELQ